MIRVLHPGLLTTVQDDGRWGYQRFGVPVAGPMDRLSHRLANLLVGNRPRCATLEATLVGPELEFEHDTAFVVTGAGFTATLDGRPAAANVVHVARSGQHLAFGDRRWGARAYVGVAGGIDVPEVLGSRATHVQSGFGGLEGRAVAAGDRLAVGDDQEHPAPPGTKRPPLVTQPRGPAVGADGGAVVRVIPGPHDDYFGPSGLAILASAAFTVDANSNRMGYRLSGPRLEPAVRRELLSAPVETGAVQVPPAGDPIVLMADHPTTGGYPRIGTVITADLPVVAQLAPADRLEFRVCGHPEALRALIAQERRLMS